MTGLSIGSHPFGVQVLGGPSPLVPVIPVAPALPSDLVSAFLDACHDGLAGHFEETDPDWQSTSRFFRDRPTRGPEPPYAEITPIDGRAAAYDSGRSYAATTEIQMSIFAENREDAVRLGIVSAAFFATTSLRWQGGGVSAMFLANPGQGAERDPEPWRDGKRLWSKVLRFRALTGGRG